MTSWPWMKNISIPIADPIDFIDEYDSRPSVKELIKEHEVKINELKDLILADPIGSTLFEYPMKHDDLWLLRFVLNHTKKGTKSNNNKDCLSSIIETLKFRKEHQLDLYDIRYDQIQKDYTTNQHCQKHFEYCTDEFVRFTIPDVRRGVIYYVRPSALDQHEIVKELPESHWLLTFLHISEWIHQWVDYVTRTTGRFTKSISLIAFKGMSVAKASKENQSRNGKAMGILDDCYPQMVHGMYLMNCPSWVQVPWRMFRPLLPKRVTDKIDFIHPADKPAELKKLLRFVSKNHLPTIYGGTNESFPPEFIIPNVPNLSPRPPPQVDSNDEEN